MPLAHAQDNVNQVVGIKILPLPDNRVRMIFQFNKPLKQKPANFTMKKPAALVFDFLHASQDLPSDMLHKLVNVGVLKKY